MDDVALVFGLITSIAGLSGVPLGSFLSQKLRPRFRTADPLICAYGMIISAPILYVGMLIVRGPNSLAWTYLAMFFGTILLNLNWSLVADIGLYVVIPTRRSTAEAFQILLSHALGDAGSPYIIGQVSELLKQSWAPTADILFDDVDPLTNGTLSGFPLLRNSTPSVNCSGSTINYSTVQDDFKELQYSLFISVIVEALGAFFFFATAWYIVEDKARVDRVVADE